MMFLAFMIKMQKSLEGIHSKLQDFSLLVLNSNHWFWTLHSANARKLG